MTRLWRHWQRHDAASRRAADGDHGDGLDARPPAFPVGEPSVGDSGAVAVRVLGVDPGTTATGYGVIEGHGTDCRLIECGVIRPTRGLQLADRLSEIHEGLLAVIDRVQPECLAVEGVFYGDNLRTAVVLAHARGVVLLAGAQRELAVAEYPPAEIKKAVVGTGRATKGQVAFMVQKLLSLAGPPEPTDAADGCAAALCHLLVGSGPLARGRAPA